MDLLTKTPTRILDALRLEHAVTATLTLHSGRQARFTCDQISVDVNDLGRITGIRMIGARGKPFYFDPQRIEAITVRATLRRRLPPVPMSLEQALAPAPQAAPIEEPLELTEVYQPEPTPTEAVHAAFKEHGVHAIADQLASVLAHA